MLETRGNEVTNSSGIVFYMLREMAKKLNFTYTVIPPKDGQFGVKVRRKDRIGRNEKEALSLCSLTEQWKVDGDGWPASQ